MHPGAQERNEIGDWVLKNSAIECLKPVPNGQLMSKASPRPTASPLMDEPSSTYSIFMKIPLTIRSSYFSWWGGELRKAIEYPVEFDVPQKLVYSPHYYSPSVYPAQYFYTGGTNTGGILVDFVEREDADLLKVVNLTMNDMFGKLAHAQDGAVIMGEFGGLYGVDKHPLKTTKRVIDYTIQNLVEPSNKFGGGYVWSLNPESGYEYNPVDTLGHFQYGLLGDDWLSAHQDYIEALSAFDAMDGMKLFPCFQDDA